MSVVTEVYLRRLSVTNPNRSVSVTRVERGRQSNPHPPLGRPELTGLSDLRVCGLCGDDLRLSTWPTRLRVKYPKPPSDERHTRPPPGRARGRSRLARWTQRFIRA